MVAYEIHDCYGVPQCGCWITYCADWSEVESYFEDADAMERLEMGYATVVTVDEA